MSIARQKLVHDLRVVEVTVGQIEVYLSDSALFWATPHADLSVLTLGEYLVRHNRLLALRNSVLKMADQERLDVASSYFDRVLYNKVEEFEQAAQQELTIRLKQWRKYLQEFKLEKPIDTLSYHSALETRVMIEDIVQKLYLLSCQPELYLVEQLDQLDSTLRHKWQSGSFVWPAEWRPAYPEAIYWWLYGGPKRPYKAAVKNLKHFVLADGRIPGIAEVPA